MNKRQTKTLAAIFEKPTRSDVTWSDVESLFTSLGGSIREGRGSRIRITIKDARAGFHRPHPSRIAGKGLVESVHDFLSRAGIEP